MAVPNVIHKNISKTIFLIQATLVGGTGQTHTRGITLLPKQSKSHKPVAGCAPHGWLAGNQGAKIPLGSPRGKGSR